MNMLRAERHPLVFPRANQTKSLGLAAIFFAIIPLAYFAEYPMLRLLTPLILIDVAILGYPLIGGWSFALAAPLCYVAGMIYILTATLIGAGRGNRADLFWVLIGRRATL